MTPPSVARYSVIPDGRLWLTIGAMSLASACRPTPASRQPAPTAGECLLLRDNRSGVIGMDVGASSSLGAGKSMFVFGDTFLGSWGSEGARRVSGSVHSAIAIVDDDASESCFAGTSFGARGRGATTYLEPVGAADDEMVWPLGPVLVRGGRIELLFTWVKRDPTDGFGFKTLGNGIVTANANATAIPVDVHSLAAPATEATPSAWLVDGPYTYLYRCSKALGNGLDPCIVGRAPIADSTKLDAYSYFVGGKGYVGAYRDGTVVTEGAPAFTVSFNAYLRSYLEVYVEPLGGGVSARQAPAPEGPFSDKKALWTCNLPKDDPKSYCYAAYEHTQLEPNGGRTVVLTYDTNSDLGSMVRHPELYWPRLVSIDLATTGLARRSAPP